jgi:hypothetical protein
MQKTISATTGLFVLAMGPLFPGFAAELSNPALLVKTHNGIEYMSGGFGQDEREAMYAMDKEDNLRLSFALQNRDYLGGAKVQIKDDQGKEVLDAVSNGPLFFTKLPTGKYTVEATVMGQTLEQAAQVPSKGQAHLYFAWKEPKDHTQTHTLAAR